MKEFQTWLQARAMFALVALVVLSLGVTAFLLGLLVLVPQPGAPPSIYGASVAPSGTNSTSGDANILPLYLVPHRPILLFGAGAISLLLVITLAAPALAATAFGGERLAGTLDLLLLHARSAGRATGAKIIAAALFMGLLSLAGLPGLAPAWMLGGVSGLVVVSALIVLASSLVLACSMGVLFSALLEDTLTGAFLAQAAMLALAILVPGAYLAAYLLTGVNPEAARGMLWLSPLVALVATGGDAAVALLRVPPLPVRAALSPLEPTVLFPGLLAPPWLPSVVLWLALAMLCWAAASVAIDPCHPARNWRLRVRRPGAPPEVEPPVGTATSSARTGIEDPTPSGETPS